MAGLVMKSPGQRHGLHQVARPRRAMSPDQLCNPGDNTMKSALLLAPVCLAVPTTMGAAPITQSPHESILSSIQALRKNDVPRLLRSMMSNQEITKLEKDWNVQRQQELTMEEEMQFQAVMGMLTADGAEDLLMEQARPKLDEMRTQVQMFSGMIVGMADAAIQDQEDLSEQEKKDSRLMLKSFTNLLTEDNICDPKRARRAIGVACSAARKLNLGSMNDVKALSFGQLMNKGSIVLAASKEVLEIYGLGIDEWLDTFTAETIEQNGEEASVLVSYEFMGTSYTSEVALVLSNGRWVQEEVGEMLSAQ